MVKLSQRDSRWASHRMLPSTLTIGRYGCTTTCISMLSDWYGHFRTPNIMASMHIPYTQDGLIIWGGMKLQGFNFQKRLKTTDHKAIQESLKGKDTSVILEVDHCHWVVALSRVPFTNTYRIADPWDGKVKLSTAYKKVTGSAHFTRS